MHRTAFRRLPACLAAAALLAGTGLITGPALADDSTTTTTTTQTTETTTTTDTTTPTETTQTTTPSGDTGTPATSGSATESGSPAEGPPTSAPTDGILSIRAIDVAGGTDVTDVPARVFRPDPADTRLPASMLLPSGRYRVELLAVPGGYRLLSPWHLEGVVPPGETGVVVFRMEQTGGPHDRVPIKSIPSGRTR